MNTILPLIALLFFPGSTTAALAGVMIAGVMGGMDTGSFDDTVNVFIESAWFDPARIARAGRKQGIISDAR